MKYCAMLFLWILVIWFLGVPSSMIEKPFMMNTRTLILLSRIRLKLFWVLVNWRMLLNFLEGRKTICSLKLNVKKSWKKKRKWLKRVQLLDKIYFRMKNKIVCGTLGVAQVCLGFCKAFFYLYEDHKLECKRIRVQEENKDCQRIS